MSNPNHPPSEPSRIIQYPKPGAHAGEAVPDLAIASTLTITAADLTAGMMAADELDSAQIPKRENLCGTWFRQGDLGFIFGPRGLGKTWLGLDLARGLSEGRPVGPWPIPTARRVLYIDGEMPFDGIRDRDKALRQQSGSLFVLNHEWLFQKTGRVLNLTDPAAQAAVCTLCGEKGFEVVVIDNLSCLFSGMPENDADAWEQVQPWLLTLRRLRVAVVLIHHAGRAGQHMRGTSKREDAAFWVLRLDPVSDAKVGAAAFISRFTKSRQGEETELEPLEWLYESEADRTRVTYRRISNAELFKQWVRDGLTKCSEIAEEMGITKGSVSKLAKRGEREGWLTIDGRDYRLNEP